MFGLVMEAEVRGLACGDTSSSLSSDRTAERGNKEKFYKKILNNETNNTPFRHKQINQLRCCA